ncbi:MAG: hypothetical protein OEX12_01075 [Gammaproteobacteria bacterium]|nr:hypothetical protein [Gammaproteobacteria bacterium]
MPTKVDIVSNALVLIGHPTISSFDPDQGSGATVGSALYTTTLRYLLSTTYWRFAIKQQSLNRLTAAPISGWQYAYQLPTDYITLHKVSPRCEYQIFEDKLYCNVTTLTADYSFLPADTSLPDYFVQAFQYKLASDFAIAVTNDTQKSQLYESKYRQEIRSAMAADAKSHPPEPIMDQPFTDVRFYGGDGSIGVF